ncbi:MAG: serine hydrolase [Candidatus Paceibacterota bacterium]|jgi:D-alanyl-D-alanine endopeptidase (penicillin-binding protein 7)
MRYFLIGGGLVALIILGIIFLLPSRPLVYRADLGGSEEDFDVSSYIFQKSDKTIPLSAGAYLVTDLETSEKVVSKNEKKVLPIASLTKLMTALVAQELLTPDQVITVSRSAYNTYGNTGRLRVGEKISVKDIFYPLLLSSSNDAAEVLAEAAGREKFLATMNARAKQIGLTDTFFADPSGLSPANTSTAADLVKLANYLYRYRPEILALTREKEHKIGKRTWTNLNNISLMPNYLGGKNGYTEEANRTLVSIFQVPITSSSTASTTVEKKSRLLALVLLQSNDRKGDTRGLINYLTRYTSYLGGKNGFVPII